jgi:hypothetical protein
MKEGSTIIDLKMNYINPEGEFGAILTVTPSFQDINNTEVIDRIKYIANVLKDHNVIKPYYSLNAKTEFDKFRESFN